MTNRSISRIIFCILAALLLAACTMRAPIAAPATPAPDGQVIEAVWHMREDTPMPRLPVEYHPFEEELLQLINEERVKAGVEPLALSRPLTEIARDHSEEMATGNFFSHNSLNGQSFQARLKTAGYSYTAASENLFAGNGPYNTPEHVIQAWLQSANHRANLLNPVYTEVGIGYRFNPASTYGGYFTVDFGTP